MSGLREGAPAASGRRGVWGRALLLTVAGSALVVGVAGCDLVTPQEEAHPNDTVGVNAHVGAVDVRDAVLVMERGATSGSPANFVVSLTNNSDVDELVTITPEGSSRTSVRIAPGDVVGFGRTPTTSIVFDSIAAPPGGLISVTFSAEDHVTLVRIPVLSTSVPFLSELGPRTMRPSSPASPTAR